MSIIKSVQEELSRIGIDGIESEKLDELWRDAWAEHSNPNLPEEKINHSIKYINAILELLK